MDGNMNEEFLILNDTLGRCWWWFLNSLLLWIFNTWVADENKQKFILKFEDGGSFSRRAVALCPHCLRLKDDFLSLSLYFLLLFFCCTHGTSLHADITAGNLTSPLYWSAVYSRLILIMQKLKMCNKGLLNLLFFEFIREFFLTAAG